MGELEHDLGGAYERYRGLLFSALGKLSHQGFPVPPTEGLDLIHDFFLEAWPKVSKSHDPSLGKMETFLYTAFVRFARPRILRLARFRGCLRDADELSALADDRHQANHEGESELDTEAIRRVMATIPALERQVLLSYAGSHPTSERDLAEAFAISRHKVRDLLQTGLARVATSLDRPPKIPETQWVVARALWHEGRTIEEASARLGMTIPEVRKARRRILEYLAGSLRESRTSRPVPAKRNAMEPNLKTLLERTLSTPGDMALLDRVRAQGPEILHYLESDDAVRTVSRLKEVDPGWLGEVYAAIAGEQVEPHEDFEIIDALFRANAEVEGSIARAFKEALMADLPVELRKLTSWNRVVPEVSKDEQDDLFADPTVIEAVPEAVPFVRYGLTPVSVFHGTEAVSMLVERLLKRGMLDRTQPFLLSSDRGVVSKRSSVLTGLQVAEEIAGVVECPQATATALLDWMVQVAQFKPLLFLGFRSSAFEKGVLLDEDENEAIDLYRRWSDSNALRMRGLAGLSEA